MVASGEESKHTRQKRQRQRIAAHQRLGPQARFHPFNLVVDLLKRIAQVALRLFQFPIKPSRFA
jgi:hypothetical protein